MNPAQIDRFFKIVAGELDQKTVAILTGAAAGSILGRVRPSIDIDFALEAVKKKEEWARLEAAIHKAVQLTGIKANYAEDIDRWGLITLLDYKRHTRGYKKFSRLEIRILDPEYWSIGKMTRYLDPDIRDMIEVFKRQKVPWESLAKVWGLALRKSTRSAALIQFRKQVEDFFRSYGRKIWGKDFDESKALSSFHKIAKIQHSVD